MNRAEHLQIIRELARPVLPIEPTLPREYADRVTSPLPRPARALLFDIYGTLFISASGDIGTSRTEIQEKALERALLTSGVSDKVSLSPQLSTQFRNLIIASHEAAPEGVEHPEVEIRRIWTDLFRSIAVPLNPKEIELVAIRFEMESNPVWPMPGARHAIRELAHAVELGIVSNAQFYTPLLFPSLFGSTLGELGFKDELIAYSFERGIAKPNTQLFHPPLAALHAQGIDSSEVVYVGNDMLNDIAAARKAGCMTILFAGDRRSLRLREGHAQTANAVPDSVARSLRQVTSIVLSGKEHS